MRPHSVIQTQTMDALQALTTVISSTRDHRMTFPIEARVRLTSPHLPSPEVYKVRARDSDGGFKARSARRLISYNPRTGRESLVVHPSSGEEGFVRHREWPWFSPAHRVLAMFAPAELGIWGGTHDEHRLCGASWLDQHAVRLDLVRRDEPAGAASTGFVEIDVANAVVTHMQVDEDHYTLEAARVVMDGSTPGPIVGPGVPGWPQTFAPTYPSHEVSDDDWRF